MDKHFIEFRLTLSSAFSELFGNLLVDNGCKGYIVEEDRKDRTILKGYIKQRSKAVILTHKVNKYVESLAKLQGKDLKIKVELKRIKEEDWSKNLKKTFKPLEVTDKIVIKPSWVRERFHQKVVIEIEPKMAFGTGVHPTTQMCLKALQRYIKHGDRMLDLGTGSGILAITAAKLGACYALALDIDEAAINNALENIIKNKVQKTVNLRLGTLEDNLPGEPFDLIAANLTKTEIAKLFKRMTTALKKEGILILSGIQVDEVKEMEEYLLGKKILLQKSFYQKGWVCFVAQKVRGVKN